MEGRRQKAEGRSWILLILLVLAACETKEHADAELGALKKAKDAAAAVNARSQSDVGVAECDAYIKNYEACLIEKVPEEKRDALRRTLNDQRRKWQDAVTGGSDTAQIAEQCKSAVSDATQKLGEYGCTF